MKFDCEAMRSSILVCANRGESQGSARTKVQNCATTFLILSSPSLSNKVFSIIIQDILMYFNFSKYFKSHLASLEFNSMNSDPEQSYSLDSVIHQLTDATSREFRLGKYLGKGGFAKCYQMTFQGKQFAGKIIPKSSLQRSSARRKLLTQIKIHRSLNNQRIVQFEHFFEDQANVYILLELCPNQTLCELLHRRKRLHDLQLRFYLRQLLQAIIYMHSKLVIHRDLKLGNLFLSHGMKLKIGDLGLAAQLQSPSQRRTTLCGTPNYIAPEIISKGSEGHGFEVDIWSFGVIAYTMAIGKPPFETSQIQDTYELIKSGTYTFPNQIHLSLALKDLISSCLIVNPSKRAIPSDLITHSFFTMTQMPPELPTSTLACPLSKKQIVELECKKQALQQSSRTHRMSHKILRKNSFSKSIPKSLSVYRNSLKGNPYLNELEAKHLQAPIVQEFKILGKHSLGYKIRGAGIGFLNQHGKGVVTSGLNKLLFYSKDNIRQVEMDQYSSHQVYSAKETILQLAEEFKGSSEWNQKQTSLYVRKWLQKPQGTVFKLNKGFVQVNLKGEKIIFFDTEKKMISLICKGKVVTLPLIKVSSTKDQDFLAAVKLSKQVLADANHSSQACKQNLKRQLSQKNKEKTKISTKQSFRCSRSKLENSQRHATRK